MKQGIKLACCLALLMLLVACGRRAAAPMPTRTPRPTFTVTANVPGAAVSPTLLPPSTATPRPGTTPLPTDTSGPVATKPTATVPPGATPVPTNTPAPTATPMPTDTPAPTATPVPTDTPVPTATPVCLPGYDQYINTQLSFSTCHPTGWAVSSGEEPSESVTWVQFDGPASNQETGNELRFILLEVLPPVTDPGQNFLDAAEQLLRDYYGNALLGQPKRIVVDGREAVEVMYELWRPVKVDSIKVTGWVVGFLVGDKQWVIEMVGRSEYRAEMEGIHNEFLSRFRILPRQ